MAKQVIGNLKLRIPGGKATAGPPVGSTLGQWGLNMMDFINPFNEKTKEFNGKNVIVHIKVYDDRTFDWTCLGQPVDDLIREKIKIEKGSGKPNLEKVGKISRADLQGQDGSVERHRPRRCCQGHRRHRPLYGRSRRRLTFTEELLDHGEFFSCEKAKTQNPKPLAKN